jgi:hypothetical protein
VETLAKENTMTRISTFCVLSSTLAVTALSANGASAVNITVHTAVPKVIVYVPQPKVNVHTPQLKILSNHGTVVGTKSGSNHGLLKDNLKGNSNEVGISAPTTIELSPNSPTVGGAYQATVVGPRIPTGGGAYQTTVAWPSSPTGGGAYQTTVVGPRIPTGGAYQTTVVGPRIPTVGVVPIIGDQEGNPDRPIIIGSVYKTTPSFSFNKIDPAAKASIVSVIQPGGAGDGTKVSILLATKPGGGIDGQNPVTSLP